MGREKILVVEDEEDILEVLSYNLIREGYQVIAEDSGEAGLNAARSELPSLVLLDVMLPGIDGWEICKILKSDDKTRHIPIIMLTARTEEDEIITGLEMGADDYVTKPFAPKVLMARVKSVLKRKEEHSVAPSHQIIHVDELLIDPGKHEVSVANVPIALTFSEFQILHFLASRPGWVYSRDQIVDAVRGEGYSVTIRSVDVQIAGIRKKLGVAGDYIQTVRGVGYRFKE